jgi:hypothetical protein
MSSTNEQDIPQAEVAAPDGTETDNLAIIARQAIVDANRAVYGYELFDRSTASDSHTAASDAALLFNALSYAGTEALVGKKTVFINCTHESLAGGHLELIHPDKVVLEVPPLPDSATAEEIEARVATLDALRTRGFRLAFDQNVLKRSYVRRGCRWRASSSSTCRPSSPSWRARWSNLPACTARPRWWQKRWKPPSNTS